MRRPGGARVARRVHLHVGLRVYMGPLAHIPYLGGGAGTPPGGVTPGLHPSVGPIATSLRPTNEL